MKSIFFLLFCSCTHLGFAQDFHQEKKVRAGFMQFRDAIMHMQADSARQYIDSHSMRYFSFVLDQTQHADSTVLDTLFSVDKLLVITLRDGVSEALLASMDSVEFFNFLVENELLAVKTIKGALIGEVVLESAAKARGQLILNGRKTPYYLNFNRENGLWKLDYTTLRPLLAQSAERTLEQREKWLHR